MRFPRLFVASFVLGFLTSCAHTGPNPELPSPGLVVRNCGTGLVQEVAFGLYPIVNSVLAGRADGLSLPEPCHGSGSWKAYLGCLALAKGEEALACVVSQVSQNAFAAQTAAPDDKISAQKHVRAEEWIQQRQYIFQVQ